MAYSRLSVDEFYSNILADEDSLDNSDSKVEMTFSYLGAFTLSRGKLEIEICNLTLRVDEPENQIRYTLKITRSH